MITSSSWLPLSRVIKILEFINALILIADLKSPIATKDLIEFLEANHHLMIFGDSDVKRPVRNLVNEFGVEFENVVSIQVLFNDIGKGL